jgi:Secretion system C-terminal sorting domain/SprB repeat
MKHSTLNRVCSCLGFLMLFCGLSSIVKAQAQVKSLEHLSKIDSKSSQFVADGLTSPNLQIGQKKLFDLLNEEQIIIFDLLKEQNLQKSDESSLINVSWEEEFASKVMIFSENGKEFPNHGLIDLNLKKAIDTIFGTSSNKRFAAIFPNKQVAYLNEKELYDLPEISKEKMSVYIRYEAGVNHNRCNNKNEGTINLIPSHGVEPYTYLWSNGETTSALKNLFAGEYICTITDAKGHLNITKPIVVNSPPKLTINTEEILKDKSGIYDLKTKVQGGIPPQYFWWKKDSVVIAKTQDLNNIESGFYKLNIQDQIGCNHEIDVAIGRVNSNEDKILESAISVFPNPSNGKVNVNIDRFYSNIEIEVIDNSGRIIKTIQLSDSNTLDLTSLNEGFYSLKFKTSKSTVTKKIIIQK